MKGTWRIEGRTDTCANVRLRWPAGCSGCVLALYEAGNAWQPAHQTITGPVVPTGWSSRVERRWGWAI